MTFTITQAATTAMHSPSPANLILTKTMRGEREPYFSVRGPLRMSEMSMAHNSYSMTFVLDSDEYVIDVYKEVSYEEPIGSVVPGSDPWTLHKTVMEYPPYDAFLDVYRP